MRARALPRLDPAPILAELARQGLPVEALAHAGGDTPARLLKKPLAWYVADRYAIALKLHPADLWGEAWWDVAKAHTEQTRARHERARRPVPA